MKLKIIYKSKKKIWILVISLLLFSYFRNNRAKSDKRAHGATQT